MSEQQPSQSNLLANLKQLFSHMSAKRRRQLGGLVIFMLFGAMAEMVTIGVLVPFLALLANPKIAHKYTVLQKLVEFFGWNDQQLLVNISIMFAVAAISAAGIRVAVAWASCKFSEVLGIDISEDVYRRTLYQPYRFHVESNSSEVISVIRKVNNVVSGIITPSVQSIIALFTTTGILLVLFYVDFVTAAIAIFGFASLYLTTSVITRRKLHINGRIISQNQTHRVRSIQEGLGGIRDIIIDGSQPIFISRYMKYDRAQRRAQAVNIFISVSPRYVIEAIGLVLILGLAFWLSQRSGGFASAIPVLGALALGAQKLLPQMQALYNSWVQISGNHAILADVLSFLDLSIPEGALVSAAGKPLRLTRAITLRDVSFRYREDTPEILKNFTLEIPRGSRVGIVGKTGSGKSTLIDLIMGLLDATTGTVEIDDEPILPQNRRSWQARIGHVPQAIFLADSSIAENIAFTVKQSDIDMERVKAAAEKAQLAEFIEALPEKYLTAVGERGVRLSGGQRQRIGLARALYKNVDVLVLDEATSALDDKTEESIMQAIGDISNEVTVLMIAHRLSTLRKCDFIVKLDEACKYQLCETSKLIA